MLRAARTGEMFLLCHLAFWLSLQRRLRSDPLDTIGALVDLARGALGPGDRTALRQALAEELADPEPPESPVMLEAAGRWFCGLALPVDDDELMKELPLLQRRGGATKDPRDTSQ
jgi:hypothetical protein